MVAVAQAQTVYIERWDNYQKQTYRNRTYIAHSNGRLILNVPIKHTANGVRQKTAEVQTENDFPWLRDHWKSIQTAYRTSPFFEFYEDDLAPLFNTPVTNLFEFNMRVFDLICELIGLSPTIKLTTSYEPIFTSGTDLRTLAAFKKAPPFTCTPYTQVLEASHGFLNNLSILDLLFNQGPATLDYLEQQAFGA